MEKLSREKILEICAKLLAKTEDRGATAAESAAAMEAVHKILAKHNLSMFEVQQVNLEKPQFNVVRETVKSVYTEIPDYLIHLGDVVARAFDCKLFFRAKQYSFVGEELDAAVAAYLYTRTSDELYGASTREAKIAGYHGRNVSWFRKSFFTGATEEIERRLEAARSSTKREHQSMGALMVLKADAVEAWIKDNVKVGQSKPIKVYAGEGYTEGRQVGKTIDLSMHGVKQARRDSQNHPKLGG